MTTEQGCYVKQQTAFLSQDSMKTFDGPQRIEFIMYFLFNLFTRAGLNSITFNAIMSIHTGYSV